jgi:hypothetical protein
MTSAHEEKETLSVDVLIPEHADRKTTSLFRRSRLDLIERDKVCWICGDAGKDKPLEAHHFPIERCLAEAVDWELFATLAKAGAFGPGPQSFDWEAFDPADPYSFVDDMLHNGLLLCKAHHTGKDEGIHQMPHALWLIQKVLREGCQFSPTEVIHHEHA